MLESTDTLEGVGWGAEPASSPTGVSAGGNSQLSVVSWDSCKTVGGIRTRRKDLRTVVLRDRVSYRQRSSAPVGPASLPLATEREILRARFAASNHQQKRMYESKSES